MKKRYQLTLTEDRVKRFQALSEKLNMPKSTLSSALDDSLLSIVNSMEKFVKKGNVSIVDLFTAIGEQIDDAMKEEKLDADAKGEKAPAKKRQAKKTA